MQADAGDEGAPLVLTPTLPPVTGRDMQGVNRRLSMFIEALDDGARPVRLLRLVPERIVCDWADRGQELDRIESAFWGRRVAVSLAPRRVREETAYAHYVQGIAGAGFQPDFFPFGGPIVEAAVAEQFSRPTSLVFVHRLPAMCALLRTQLRPARMFFDLDDLEHGMRLRQVGRPPFWPGKLAYALHVPAVLLAELQGASASRATFVCSQRDRDHLTRLGGRRVAVTPNAVAAPASPPPLSPEPTILHLGAMSYRPNAQTAERLVRRIMPLVWKQAPAARLLLAGDGSQSLPSAQGGEARIEHLGFVDDLDALYARARIVCCPLTDGGGTRVKLVEAAAYARPMAATRVGAEGLAFEDGADILIRDDDQGLADACVRLLADDSLAARLGQSARAKMLREYERSSICTRIRGLLERAA